MTKALLTLLCLAAAGSLEAGTHAKYKIRWLIGHPNLDYFEEAARSFKEAVERGSGGEIAVEISESSLGESSDHSVHSRVISAVTSGEAEMGHTFTDVAGVADPRLWAFEAPGLFRGYRHLEGVIEGPLGKEMLEGLRAKGLVGLSFTYSGGANGVATRRKEIRRPEDLRGLKVGVFADPVSEAWLKALGAVPVPMAHDVERIPQLSPSGGLDAVVITWRNLHRSRLPPSVGYMNLVGTTYLASVTYVNKAYFDALPERHRALLLEASRKAGAIERAKTIQLNESGKKELLARGVQEVPLSREGREAFAKAFAPVYEKSLNAILGEKLAARIRATADKELPDLPGPLAGSGR